MEHTRHMMMRYICYDDTLQQQNSFYKYNNPMKNTNLYHAASCCSFENSIFNKTQKSHTSFYAAGPHCRYNYSNFVLYLTFFNFLIIWRASNKSDCNIKPLHTVRQESEKMIGFAAAVLFKRATRLWEIQCFLWSPYASNANPIITFFLHPRAIPFASLRSRTQHSRQHF